MSKTNESAVHRAVMIRRLTSVRQAIAEGEGVDTLDQDGRTPLFYASGDGAVEIVSELIHHGARPDKRDRNLETPLHFAAREYHLEVAGLLIKHGANVDAQDVHGNTPLSNAVFYSRGRGDLIKLLLSSGADKALKNRHGISPEDLADTIANFNVRQFLNK